MMTFNFSLGKRKTEDVERNWSRDRQGKIEQNKLDG